MTTSQVEAIAAPTTKRAQHARYALVLALHKQEMGKLIARRRKALGLTQKELAEAAHVQEPQTVSRWERGISAPTDIEVVAQALQTTTAEIMQELTGAAQVTQRDRRRVGLRGNQLDRIERMLEDVLERLEPGLTDGVFESDDAQGEREEEPGPPIARRRGRGGRASL